MDHPAQPGPRDDRSPEARLSAWRVGDPDDPRDPRGRVAPPQHSALEWQALEMLLQRVASIRGVLVSVVEAAEAIARRAGQGEAELEGLAERLTAQATAVAHVLDRKLRALHGVLVAPGASALEPACRHVLASLHAPLLSLCAHSDAAAMLVASVSPVSEGAAATYAREMARLGLDGR